MTTAQNNRYLALLNPFANKSVQIVSTGDVRNYQINDTLPFQIPGRAGLIVAVATEVVLNQSSGFSWSAKIINEPGYVSLQYRNNQIFGFIQIENDFYELMPMDDTHQFLVNRLIDSERDCGMPSSSPTSPSPPGPNECSEPPAGFDPYNTCPAIVSVLLVITNEAKIWILENYGSIEAFALEGQSIVNLAFLNSDIPNKEVRVRWIERNYSVLLSPLNDIEVDRLGLPTLLGFDRTGQLADLAFLITNQGYPDASGAVSDIAVNSGTSYGIIEAPFFNAAYSFPHELGHLMGCHHNWTKNLGDDDTDVIAHAFRHIYH